MEWNFKSLDEVLLLHVAGVRKRNILELNRTFAIAPDY
jgi:hypothetical protein